jgi:hypothetical protein
MWRKKSDLPKSENEGVLLSVNALDAAKIAIQVVEKSIKQETYFLVAQRGGEIFYHTKITAANGTSTLELDKTKLPGGILKFNLFSSNLVPVCERLVFNNQVEVVNLVIKPDKPEYKQREKSKNWCSRHHQQRRTLRSQSFDVSLQCCSPVKRGRICQ